MIKTIKTVLHNKKLIPALWLSLLLPVIAFGQNIPKRPEPPRLVNDIAGVMSANERDALERKLVAYDDSTSNQIAVVLVNTLDNYPIEEFALQLFRSWGIGNKTTNNGILIVAAIQDRKIRIETGYGLEGAVPDITANQIITNDIAPEFRNENYYEGLQKATSSIMAAAAGEYKAPDNYRDRGRKGKFPIGLIIIIIILIIMFNRRNRGGGGGFMSRRGYRRGLGPLIFPGGFGSGGGFGGGFGGGGFGGGGFGGFGGGSSGGGGASGSW
jgi:uncharacterized protein